MKKILMIVLFALVIYLVYLYWSKYIDATKSDNDETLSDTNKEKKNEIICKDNVCKLIQKPKQKIIKKRIINKQFRPDVDSNIFINNLDEPNIQKNINPVLIESEDNYQLTEGALDQLDNVFNEYMQSKKRPHVFFDIGTNGEVVGRIIIELYDDVVPYTVNNFIHMVQNNYKNSIFHRIIKDFVIQGGDFINGDGTGSTSIYGDKFKDENFNLKHDSKYLLSMANSGPDTNGCQFFITLNKTPHLDGKHVVFGKVISDPNNVIDYLSNVIVNPNDRPATDCVIYDCGIIDTKQEE